MKPSKKESKRQRKFAKVMREFKVGKLHIGTSDKIVESPRQAKAIALSQIAKMDALSAYSLGVREAYRQDKKGKPCGKGYIASNLTCHAGKGGSLRSPSPKSSPGRGAAAGVAAGLVTGLVVGAGATAVVALVASSGKKRVAAIDNSKVARAKEIDDIRAESDRKVRQAEQAAQEATARATAAQQERDATARKVRQAEQAAQEATAQAAAAERERDTITASASDRIRQIEQERDAAIANADREATRRAAEQVKKIQDEADRRIAQAEQQAREQASGAIARVQQTAQERLAQFEQEVQQRVARGVEEASLPKPQQGFNRRNLVHNPEKGISLRSSKKSGVDVDAMTASGRAEQVERAANNFADREITRQFGDLGKAIRRDIDAVLKNPDTAHNIALKDFSDPRTETLVARNAALRGKILGRLEGFERSVATQNRREEEFSAIAAKAKQSLVGKYQKLLRGMDSFGDDDLREFDLKSGKFAEQFRKDLEKEVRRLSQQSDRTDSSGSQSIVSSAYLRGYYSVSKDYSADSARRRRRPTKLNCRPGFEQIGAVCQPRRRPQPVKQINIKFGRKREEEEEDPKKYAFRPSDRQRVSFDGSLPNGRRLPETAAASIDRSMELLFERQEKDKVNPDDRNTWRERLIMVATRDGAWSKEMVGGNSAVSYDTGWVDRRKKRDPNLDNRYVIVHTHPIPASLSNIDFLTYDDDNEECCIAVDCYGNYYAGSQNRAGISKAMSAYSEYQNSDELFNDIHLYAQNGMLSVLKSPDFEEMKQESTVLVSNFAVSHAANLYMREAGFVEYDYKLNPKFQEFVEQSEFKEYFDIAVKYGKEFRQTNNLDSADTIEPVFAKQKPRIMMKIDVFSHAFSSPEFIEWEKRKIQSLPESPAKQMALRQVEFMKQLQERFAAEGVSQFKPSDFIPPSLRSKTVGGYRIDSFNLNARYPQSKAASSAYLKGYYSVRSTVGVRV